MAAITTRTTKCCSREPNCHWHHQSQMQTPLLLLPLPVATVVTITRATTTRTTRTATHTQTATAILAIQQTKEQNMRLTVLPMRVCSGSVACNTHTQTHAQKSLPGQLFIWSADDSSNKQQQRQQGSWQHCWRFYVAVAVEVCRIPWPSLLLANS